jgi:transcriptional regulator with XRE-family HTH domain
VPASPPTNKWLGLAVRELRTRKGLSQEELARASGLHPTYISSVERGERNISLVNIHVLALGLGVQPHEMLQPSSG